MFLQPPAGEDGHAGSQVRSRLTGGPGSHVCRQHDAVLLRQALDAVIPLPITEGSKVSIKPENRGLYDYIPGVADGTARLVATKHGMLPSLKTGNDMRS